MSTVVQPFPPRTVVSEDTDGLRIHIPPKKGWVILFLVVWISFWTFGGITTGRSLLQKFNLFPAIWMIGWLFGEVYVGYAILYALAGREIILVNGQTLTRRTEIFGVGWSRTYLAHQMRDLRFRPESGGGRSRTASRIVFDYGAKTVCFAQDIEEAEAADLIPKIQRRCNVVTTPSPQEAGIKFWRQQ